MHKIIWSIILAVCLCVIWSYFTELLNAPWWVDTCMGLVIGITSFHMTS